MNILFICDEYPPGKNGGIGTAVQMLCTELEKKGHGLFVVGLYPHGYGGPDYEEQGNIKIWRLRYRTDVGLISANNTLKDKLLLHALRLTGILTRDAARQLQNMWQLVKELIATHHIHIAEMPDWNNFYFNVRLKDLVIPALEVPLIVKLHGTLSYFNAEQGLPRRQDMYLKEARVLERANALASVSAYTGRINKELYRLNAPITTLYNGVTLHPYVAPEQRLKQWRVVFSGSLFYKKGIYSLVKAWKEVLSHLPNASLHIYGKGNRKALLKLMDENTKKTVHFYGHVARETLLKQWQTASLGVFPSYSETFGLGVAEAMSFGCPVIYTSRSCGPEIIEQMHEGILVDPGNIREISNAIVLLLGDAGLQAKLGAGGYEKVKKNFEIGHVAQRHLDFYNELAAQYKKPS